MATINGTSGNDVITGTTSDDAIFGDAGKDRINGGAGNDLIYGGAGADTLTGDAGNDTLYGGDDNDGFFGGGGNDFIFGEAGNDVMYGDGGDDFLYGGDGDDSLFGGTGNDTLYGGAGVNILNGGSGVDTLVFEFDSSALTAAVLTDLVALRDWMSQQLAVLGSTTALAAQTSGASITLLSLGATVSNIETFKIFVDGVETSLDSLVAPLNQAPTASALASISTDEDLSVSGAVAATDANGDALTWAVSQGPAHGVLALNAATGAYTFTPTANFTGADTFKVVVSDGNGGSVEQDVTVAIAAVNDAPTAETTVSLATEEDAAVSGSVAASDVDGDTLTWTLAQGPAHGALSINSATGAFTYTPNANYSGGDSFKVTVSDGNGGSAEQAVSVSVAPVNDAPVASGSQTIIVNEDQSISGAVTASDADGDTLTWSILAGAANGAVTLNGATGAFIYTPASNYHGGDTFTVMVSDGNGGLAEQTVSVAVNAVNDAPVADASSALQTNEDQSVSGQVSASDIDGDTLTWTISSGAAHGAVALNAATGAYTYTPAANFSGADAFKVAVSDGKGGTVEQTVSVAIAAVNDAPTAAATSSKTGAEDTIITGNVSASDVDGDTLTWTVSQGPAHGSISLNASTGAYTFTPSANYNGGDTFKVIVSDGKSGSAEQTVSITVTPVNDAPAIDATASLSTTEDAAVSGIASASDIDGDTLAYTVGAAAHGAVSINSATGAYTYTPTANFSGKDEFDIVAKDGAGASATQRVSVAITAAADAPTLSVVNPAITPTGATGGLFGASPSGTVVVAIEIAAALADVDGSETLSIQITGVPAGSVFSGGVKNSDGSWTLTAADLAGLTLTANTTSDFTLAVTATATESTGATASSTANLLVDLQAASNSYSGALLGNTINGSANNDRITGDSGNETINGNNGHDWIDGGNGNDSIYGGAGNDVIFGGNGNDTFYADAGNDLYNGGNGTDTLTYASASSGVTFDIGRGVIYGTSTGVDSISGGVIERLIGSNHADTFTGSAAADTFSAGGGNDVIRGAVGADVLTGGSGDDRYVWFAQDVGGVDRITDFDDDDDILDFSSLVDYTGGPVSDYIRFRDVGDDTIISANIGGSFVDIVRLEDEDNVSATGLFNSGHLLLF